MNISKELLNDNNEDKNLLKKVITGGKNRSNGNYRKSLDRKNHA